MRVAMKKHYRALFISDVHLGARDCKAELLLQTLHHIQADIIYLLGDIIDLWAIKKYNTWRPEHGQLLDHLRLQAQQGARIIYVPGNHDAPFREFTGTFPKGIEVHLEAEHTTANGRRLLLIHGDRFDQAMHSAPWLYWLGDKSYDLLLFLNRCHAVFNQWRGQPYWSLAGFIKTRLGGAQQLLRRFRSLALQHAQHKGYDGIICGHIHHPEIHRQQALIYANCGDWVESCTLLAECPVGELSLINGHFYPPMANPLPEALSEGA